MNPKKKTVRRKAYKNMSVNELVNARKELSDKINQIDIILSQAVEAVKNTGIKTNPSYNNYNYNKSSYDPAFGNPNNYIPKTNREVLNNASGLNNIGQDNTFTYFDVDSYTKNQEQQEQQYLAENPSIKVPVEYDFNNEEVDNEIASLKEQINNSKNNEGDSGTDT